MDSSLAARPRPASAAPAQCIAYGTIIATAAERRHVPPLLLAATAAQETGGPGADSGRNVVGANGGHGVFQIDARAWPQQVASGLADDPKRAADFAANLLAEGLRRHGGDVVAALHDYNAGPDPHRTTTSTQWPDGRLSYEASVLRHLAQLHAHHAALTCQ